MAAVEPKLTTIVYDTEHEEEAARVSDRLHRNGKPLTFRLVLVLQTQLRTDFVRTQIVTKLLDPRADGTELCAVLETEFCGRCHTEFKSDWNRACREGGLAEDVIATVADFATSRLESLPETIGIRDAGAELQRAEGREKLRYSRDDEFIAEKHLRPIFTTELVDDSVEPIVRSVSVLGHGIPFPTDSRSASHLIDETIYLKSEEEP